MVVLCICHSRKFYSSRRIQRGLVEQVCDFCVRIPAPVVRPAGALAHDRCGRYVAFIRGGGASAGIGRVLVSFASAKVKIIAKMPYIWYTVNRCAPRRRGYFVRVARRCQNFLPPHTIKVTQMRAGRRWVCSKTGRSSGWIIYARMQGC